jgi:hypothetical protein
VAISLHFKDLLSGFNRAGVRYLVVGAHAVAHYDEPRYTKDLDVWVDSTPENAGRVYHALAEFGAPLVGISPGDFTMKEMVYQVGVAPVRVDVLMSVSGVEFEEAWHRRTEINFEELCVPLLSLEDLIRSKEAAGRPQDRRDVRRLRRRTRSGTDRVGGQ